MKTAKQIALELIAPYYIDPTICGIENGECKYLTEDGKMCVAGKCMIDAEQWGIDRIGYILLEEQEEEVFTPEFVNVFNSLQWTRLQNIHDNIAHNNKTRVKKEIVKLNLFTLAELEEYCKTIKTK